MKQTNTDLAAFCRRPSHVLAQGMLCLLLELARVGNATESGSYTYEVAESSITITSYFGTGGSVAIPGAIDGVIVTRVGYAAFAGATTLTSLILPDTVTNIADFALYGCTGLTNITLGNGVSSIGDGAFETCGVLPNIVLPDSVIHLGNEVFKSCTALTNITLGSGVSRIGHKTFEGCAGLTTLTLPNAVTNIGDVAFRGCTGLTSLTIGPRVASIGAAAFQRCTSLATITVNTLNANYSDREGVLFNKERNTLMQYPAGRAGGYGIPNSVTNIESGAFFNCFSLTSISIPNGVLQVNSYEFSRCIRLTSVTLPGSVSSIGERAFLDCTELTSVYTSGNAPKLGTAVFENATNATVYYLADTTGWGTVFGGCPTALWNPSYRPWAEACGLAAKYPDACGEQDDPDQDGLTNIQEMTAGTDPTQRGSALMFEALARPGDLSDDDKTSVGPSQFALYFQSVPGKTYEVQSADALGGSWTPTVSATATTTQKRVLLSRPAMQGFYRVVIR